MTPADDARRAAAFGQAVEALMVFDERGIVLDVNQAAAELLDMPRERLVGYPPADDLLTVVRPDGSAFTLEDFPVVRCLRSGETVAPTLMGLGPPARRVWVQCSAAPLPQGGAVAMMVDVSGLVRAEEALRESEAMYRLVVDNSVDVVSVWRPDEGEVFVSPAAERITGWTREQRRDDDEWARVHPDDLPRMRALREDVVAGRVAATTVVFRARHADGDWYWHEMAVRAVPASDGGLEVHSSVRDVTDRVAAEQARRGADARWRAAFDHGPLGQALVDVDGVPLSANEALRGLLGGDPQDARDRSVLEAVHPDDRDAAAGLLAAAHAGRSGGEAVVRVGAGEGRWTRWSAAPVEGADSGTAYLVLQVLDVDEGVRLRDRLQHAADHDALTGLANRTHLAALLRAALDRARLEGTHVAVCYLDLDGFKAANDSLGHSGGDLILCAAADRLRGVARDGDVLARVGGDEFVVVAHGVADDAAAEALARRLHEVFRAPLDVGGHRFALSASLGVALSDGETGAAQAERLLGDADAAMYAAKRRGRARWARFDEAMAAARIDRFALERELREALAAGELEAYLQPVVALGTGRVVGAEALVRWHHPTRGLLLPADFLGVAEDSDLVVPLGWQVLEQALDTLAAQGDDGPWISVNLSPRQLIDAGMAEQVIGLLARRGVAAGRLVLEVTESALLEGGPVVEELAALHAAGVRIALDDFGTGYSSLTHLRTLPVSLLKLDRAFLATLGADPAAAALVASVVALAHALDMPAVAEGVETPEQAALLVELGCDLGQGWWFGAAVPPGLTSASARPADRA